MSHRHWQQPPAGGRAGRRRPDAGPLPRHSNRPSLLILGTHRLSVDQGGYLVFTGPLRLRPEATAENSVKLEKFEKFNDINVLLS